MSIDVTFLFKPFTRSHIDGKIHEATFAWKTRIKGCQYGAYKNLGQLTELDPQLAGEMAAHAFQEIAQITKELG